MNKLMRWVCITNILILGVFTWMGSMHAEPTGQEVTAYFSSDYREARTKFLEASQAIGARIESFKNPVAGLAGELLYTDVASIGAKDAKYILVLGSGTHGVEGFAGSGIQTGLLREGIVSNLNSDMGIVMIHAINPYGFAYLRRFNEDNVDLNRNFVDHSDAYPKNDGYVDLADTISPKTLSILENTKSLLTLFWYGVKNGRDELKKAISKGQYSYPHGLFYGGKSEAWSNRTLREIAKRYLSNAERLVFIDFHTGLGPYGSAEVILNVPQYSPAYKRAVNWWGDSVKTTLRGESVSVHLQGTIKLALPKMLPNSEVTAVALEFGTVSRFKVFWALRAENWLHHHGDKKHSDAKKIKTKLLRAFYPIDDDWKVKIWEQGKKVVEQVFVHF